ncbi:HD domain-containing protein [Bdellovibrio svalbardensis]|uniref:HD family phosphohydrolase n=1 Tax=Bdellovibrio svalbardensis TaxID=2972972 RepID=A0ABT6DH60_9BACT|nr:HD family phosphohydrolase [Bdellovibrio svalbardensis]MDG0815844.1 HD family phosphohydrolase [Bdellovibrio svalbardensis]
MKLEMTPLPDRLNRPEVVEKSWVVTLSGSRFSILKPEPEAVKIEDIACALARQARFNGHTRFFYSVGQHSCLGAQVSPTKDVALQMLFHDATEAYVGDLVSPVKALLPDFEIIESRIHWAIAQKFGLEYPMPKIVKQIDRRLLATEIRDLITKDLKSWNIKEDEPFDFPIIPWPPEVTEARFLELARELMK